MIVKSLVSSLGASAPIFFEEPAFHSLLSRFQYTRISPIRLLRTSAQSCGLTICLILLVCYASLLNETHAAEPRKKSSPKKLELQDIFASPQFAQRGVSGLRSMADGEHYTAVSRGHIIRYAYATGKAVDTLFRSGQLIDPVSGDTLPFDDYNFCSREQRLLLSTKTEPIYRHSSREINYIYDRRNGQINRLSMGGKQAFAQFSPDGEMVAFMRDNNLFISDLNTFTETQITSDGRANEIINGGTDWVYEEEFGFTRAFFWSPDSRRLLYYRFDEREVPEFVMPLFHSLYPEPYRFKYPKAGEKNALVELHLYELGSGQRKKLDVGPEPDQYIARAGWTTDPNRLWFQRVNRHQNRVELVLADPQSSSTRVVLTDSSNAWVDILDDLTFLKNGREFIWSSEKSGFQQLYLHQIDGQEIRVLSQPGRDVTDFYGVDESTNQIYYSLADPSPMERRLFVQSLDGTPAQALPGPVRGKTKAYFSANFRYYIRQHTDINSPAVWTLHHNDGREIRVLEDNQALRKQWGQYNLSPRSFISFVGPSGDSLNGFMVRPPDFNARKKYPVLMFVYGGPGSQTVDASLGQYYMWFQYLAQEGYIVVSVDGRGTGFRGANFKKCTYLQLGKYELEDQKASARYLQGLPYVDAGRIGIFGWSYGGYMSSLAAVQGDGLFKAAVAVAPVINWRYYDSIYTERFMRTPQENPRGYDDNSPSTYADRLKSAYLLIHGTADDNVHFQNALVMTQKLTEANRPFDFMAYTDKNHGIGGGHTRLHLFTTITRFLRENL
ncbi:MAG: S9 family peptidase [Bacteroidia bacterium]